MLDKIKQFLHENFQVASPSSGSEADDRCVRVAIAALLVEMARADFVEDNEEREIVLDLLKGHFFLEGHEAEELLGKAGSRVDEAVSLHEFTRAIHDELSEPQKHRFLEMLMEVAMADGEFDKHEHHLLSKVADLIYVKRTDFMRIRAKVIDATGSG